MGFGSVIEAPAKLADQALGFVNNPFGLFDRDVASRSSFRDPDFKEGLVITPIIDGAEKPEKEIRLAANLMPQVPFTWGGELRTQKDYYPGNTEPVTQVLGSTETDITLKGRFYAKRMKLKGMRTFPAELVDELDAIRYAGNMVVIRLGEFKRYGFLTKTVFNMDNLSDIEYELTFSIVGFYLPRFCQVIDEQRKIPFELNELLKDDLAAFYATYSVVPASTPGTVFDFANELISDVASAIGKVTGFIDDVVATAENVVSTYQRALGTVKFALVSVQRFRRRIASLANNAAITSNDFFSLVTKYNIGSHFTKASSASYSLTTTLESMRLRFAELSKTVPQARHRVTDGQSLQQISSRYYNTPNEWKKIYDHNKLTSTNLTSGTVLEIPKL